MNELMSFRAKRGHLCLDPSVDRRALGLEALTPTVGLSLLSAFQRWCWSGGWTATRHCLKQSLGRRNTARGPTTLPRFPKPWLLVEDAEDAWMRWPPRRPAPRWESVQRPSENKFMVVWRKFTQYMAAKIDGNRRGRCFGVPAPTNTHHLSRRPKQDLGAAPGCISWESTIRRGS